ncbi:ABC transporter substrate-binding protein [Vibrio sp. FNV 38]|nr:ABC transporter substrate-binding protein [Vibrio sp. FNV 38]
MNNYTSKLALVASTISMVLSHSAISQDSFDLDQLIEAAKQEAPITVYAPSGKIVATADNFTEKYGVKATGSKVSSSAQVEMMIREFRANNIRGDVVIAGDASAAMAQLIPMNIVESWVSPDQVNDIPKAAQDPLLVYGDPAVWSYNNEVHESCPISNVWELTERTWNRKVAIQDPLNKVAYLDLFNQLESHHDEAMAQAYEAHFGKILDTSKYSATSIWVQSLAKNAPLTTDSDSATGDVIGAPGQDDAFVGLVSTAKYRDVAKGSVHLSICDNVAPFTGWSTPAYGVMSTKTKSPNAAKLFLHFLMTEEGIANQTIDGKVSGNPMISANLKEASGVQGVYDQVLQYSASTGLEDFDNRQDWIDLWRMNYTR